jgi:hypothetical protein
VASSRQRASLGRDGRPAKRSRTEPTIVSWWGESLMPGAVVTCFVSMSRFEVERFAVWILGICDRNEILGVRRDCLQVVMIDGRILVNRRVA